MEPVNIAPLPQLEPRLEAQAVLYPSLRQLVRLLPLNHKQILRELQIEAKQNPFLIDTEATEDRSELLIGDQLPNYYEPAAASESLQAHLEAQIAVLSIPNSQRQKLLALIQWLSPSGYLEESPSLWAAGTPWHPQELEAMVPLLQSLDPPGVGARSLQECLLLQLPDASVDTPVGLAALLVRHHLDELASCINAGETGLTTLLKRLQQQQIPADTTLARLQQAIRQIQALEPRPGRNFSHTPTVTITPDLLVQRQPAGNWQVSLAYEIKQRFALNSEAVSLLQTAQKPEEIQRLQALLQKAQAMLTALNQWQENLLTVGQFLCERQQTFLSSRDPGDLIATPQQLVAQSVGLSNATVSRIVRHRHLRIQESPEQTIPLASLCVSTAVSGRTPQQVQQYILELIQTEPPSHPYSDTELAQLLNVRFGLSIARRTVAKYRSLLGIANLSNRRKHS